MFLPSVAATVPGVRPGVAPYCAQARNKGDAPVEPKGSRVGLTILVAYPWGSSGEHDDTGEVSGESVEVSRITGNDHGVRERSCGHYHRVHG